MEILFVVLAGVFVLGWIVSTVVNYYDKRNKA